MKHIVRLLTLLLTLTLALPCALAETTYAPIEPWLQGNQPAPAPYAPLQDCFLPENGGYIDDSLSITIETTFWTEKLEQVEVQAEGVTRVLIVRVKLTDATQFRTALAGKYPSKTTARVEQMAERNNAVLAINGDFFNYHDSGIAYRNGRRMRFNANNLRELLIIDEAGDFHYLRPTSKKAWDAYIANGGTVLHTYWFGPNLIQEDGQPMQRFTNNENNGPLMQAQRMVIGQTGPLEYMIVCCEGPESTDFAGQGFTLPQMAQLCYQLGMDNAYNLDGGVSTTMVLNGVKISSPSNPKRREVGDCIYFCTLIPNE